MSQTSKHTISSPIEAGPSLLESKQLPEVLNTALEYVSTRLARKKLHLTLIVIRKDGKTQTPLAPAISSPPLSSSSPVTMMMTNNNSETASISSASTNSSFSRTKWASLPASPKDRLCAPPSPRTPSHVTSINTSTPTTTPWIEPEAPNRYGIALMHASTLTHKAEKILRSAIHRAEKKFPIGTGWLPSNSLSTPITCTSTNDIVRRSLAQNSLLFTAEGLTLLALDSVYKFKSQLHRYSRTLSAADLTLAVDELHRLVLARNGTRITKGYLMRAYDWLAISFSALVDVNEAYKSTYGGPTRRNGIEVYDAARPSPPPIQTAFSFGVKKMKLTLEDVDGELDGLVDVGESAKGKDYSPLFDQLFYSSGLGEGKEDRGPHFKGPTTPNAKKDISPVTGKEWAFLMKQNRRQAIELW